MIQNLLKLMLMLLLMAAGALPAGAQRPGFPTFQPPGQGQPAAPRERSGVAGPQAIPEARAGDSREESADGWGGMAEMQIAPGRRPDLIQPPGWWLGVYTYNTSSGVVITRVVPNSPAARYGLERGDRIVTVGGYQVGYVNRYLYTLGAELQQRADRRGEVSLLVQNWRNDRLSMMDVRLAPARGRDRSFPLPGFERELPGIQPQPGSQRDGSDSDSGRAGGERDREEPDRGRPESDRRGPERDRSSR